MFSWRRGGRGPRPPEGGDVAGPAGLGQQVALVEVAAELAGHVALLAVLDPFGDDPQPEPVAELGDGGHDALVLGVGAEAASRRNGRP